MIVPKHIKENVGFLHTWTPNGYAALGTCFFIGVKEHGQYYVYIATAKHVVKPAIDNNDPIYIRLNQLNAIDVGYVELRGNWVYHDDDAVDLAVISTDGHTSGPELVSVALPSSNIVTKDGLITPITEGFPVFLVGLLGQYQGHKRNFPVVRHGHLALITDEPIDGPYGESLYYIVECHAWPGNSGSPLFIPATTKKNPQKTPFSGVRHCVGLLSTKPAILCTKREHHFAVTLRINFGNTSSVFN